MSVIVPVRNGERDLPEMLAALDAQTLPRGEFEIVIGDDGSTDGSVDQLPTGNPRLRVVKGPPRSSYSARNRAAAASHGSILAFCDADCRPEPDWLVKGIEALERAEIVAGLIRFVVSERPTLWALVDMSTFLDQERSVRRSNAVTANLFVTRSLFEAVGGFDDSLPEHGDFDFVERCVAAGGRLALEREAVVWHPTRNEAKPFLRKVWIMHRWYAAREARARRRPNGLKLRSWVPFVQTIRARRRGGRSLGLDGRRLAENGLQPRLRDHLRAIPVMYLVVPYVAVTAEVRGWLDGRRLR